MGLRIPAGDAAIRAPHPHIERVPENGQYPLSRVVLHREVPRVIVVRPRTVPTQALIKEVRRVSEPAVPGHEIPTHVPGPGVHGTPHHEQDVPRQRHLERRARVGDGKPEAQALGCLGPQRRTTRLSAAAAASHRIAVERPVFAAFMGR